jgi:putative ABC transport system permease protein
MMLFKLSLRNITRNLKNYAIYFATLVLGTAIFYIFNSLESQTVMLNVSGTQHEMIDLMNEVMGALSVGVAVVLGFLILYASRFLMKQRKREFGIYMTLGMSKGQISRILLFETIAIGVVSLAIGLGLGVLASQAMSVFVASIFEANMTQFEFVFSSSAALTTLAMFGAIYLVVAIFNTIATGRTRLINLIRSSQTNEKVKFRGPVFCTVLFIAAIALLAYAYHGVTGDLTEIEDPSQLIVFIAAGVAGTFALFWSWSGLALRIAQKFKGFYYRKLNLFVLREVNSKINTTVVSMSMISLLLFLTIGIFSTAMSINKSMTAGLKEFAPVDLEIGNYGLSSNPNTDSYLTAEQILQDKLGVNINETFSSYATANLYTTLGIDSDNPDDTLTDADTVGEEALKTIGAITHNAIQRYLYNTHEEIMKVGDYNRLAALYNKPAVEIGDSEYAVVSNFKSMTGARDYALSHNAPTLKVAGQSLTPKYNKTIDGFIHINSSAANIGVIIVPDHLDLSNLKAQSLLAGNYRATAEEDKARLDNEIYQKVEQVGMERYVFLASKIGIYENSVGISAMATFVGLYLGSIFLITSAAILGLKEVSESTDNREKYLVLSKLGVDRGTLNRALFTQIGLFFGLPLLVACVHSVFGIMFANEVILTFTGGDLLWSIVATALFIIAIYGGYFVLTCLMSRRIILQE